MKVWHCVSCICGRLEVGPEAETHAASTCMYTRTHQYAGVIYEHMVKIGLHAGVSIGAMYNTSTRKISQCPAVFFIVTGTSICCLSMLALWVCHQL